MRESVSISLCGSRFDTFLSLVDGFGNVIAYKDDVAGCGTQSGLTFNTEGLGLVYIIVEGWGNAAGEYIIEMDANYLDINELNIDNLIIYPNPANHVVEVKKYNGNLKIVDITGKLVKEINSYSGGKIDISDIQNGIYQIQLIQNNQLKSKRLIVNKDE